MNDLEDSLENAWINIKDQQPHNRKFIGIEKVPEYFDIDTKRVGEVINKEKDCE